MKPSTRASVVRTAVFARFAAASLVAVASVRLAAVSTVDVFAAQAPRLAGPRASAAAPVGVPDAKPSASAVRTTAVAAPANTGKAVRMSLVVTLAGRSEIYVDDFFVGKSPYIGDVACKVGNSVAVEVVPAKGSSQLHKYTCAENGTIHIGD